MVAFDLGANIGYITLILADLVGKNGQVYAVEPSPRNFEILTKNIELNNCADRVSAYQLAISDKDGMTSFFLSSSSETEMMGINLAPMVKKRQNAATPPRVKTHSTHVLE